MSLLFSTNYDPAAAVTKATTTAQAMTAFDTTNLRASFVVPTTGKVLVRIACAIHGASTAPQILLGVLEGATVLGRVAPKVSASNAAATTLFAAEALLVIAATPGASVTWDAAYAVETLVASTGIKYGGPNNTTANDAYGAITFEVWAT